ncbi:uncharacterized protein LOC132061247 [Lycium ferocissimum]|uniref:uncharacterized protein LOC132061247 n=1 Tax=Lycium ferocissimum TaxID=112874 RepID=UPI002814BE97|nr:uncharacterized protein LOC132061247 [Lycium ferocissimum]
MPASFRKKVNLNSFWDHHKRKKDQIFRTSNVVYSDDAVLRWFSVGLPDHSRFSSLLTLQPVPVDSFELRSGQKPLWLFLSQGCSEGTNELIDTPWLFVAANVKQDLFLSFQHMKREMEEADMAQVKPSVVARFGKVFFYGISSACKESLKTNSLIESTLREMKRSFHTDVPSSYMSYIENQVVKKLGLEYIQWKELYYVKLSDKLRPESTVSCKCTMAKVVDEEINELKDLIGSTILDSEVQGGLRWPFGKISSGGRYVVIGIGHTTSKSYRNSSIRFKLRHADRFDFRSTTGEVTKEIFLKIPGIISQLRKQTVGESLVFELLEDNLKLI